MKLNNIIFKNHNHSCRADRLVHPTHGFVQSTGLRTLSRKSAISAPFLARKFSSFGVSGSALVILLTYGSFYK